MTAAARWAADLAAWRIPEEILARAPQSPWIHPVELFTVAEEVPDSPSHDLARQALRAHEGSTDASVLDLGCGGGRASFALTDAVTEVIGVDHQQSMLDAYADAATRRGLRHTEILGDWPDVADRTPVADVVVVHHVVYNVADLAGFARAADAHARRRVVLELPTRHPLAHLAPSWKHFWDLDRPAGPTAADALEVLRQAGLPAQLTSWVDTGRRGADLPMAKRVEFQRIRLCLPPERDAEVAELMLQHDQTTRELAAIWWDVAR